MTRINNNVTTKTIKFRWAFIVIPLLFFVISLVLTAVFFPQLPDQAAYHFQDGVPDRLADRGVLVAWLVVPQLFFVLMAFIVVRLVLLSARYWPIDNTLIRRILPIMGNILALPQIVLTFAMLDIFLYNAYQIRLIPLWIFTIIIMILGVIILGMFFFQTIRQSRRQRAKTPQE